MIYNSIKITQTAGQGVDIELDGQKVQGCRSATLNLNAGYIPVVTLELFAQTVDCDMVHEGKAVFKLDRPGEPNTIQVSQYT